MSRTLRIHFTSLDLARTFLADTPDALWETVLSIHLLHARRGRSAFGEWRRRVVRDLNRRNLAGRVRAELFTIAPAYGYFPDFLTPAEGRLGLEAGLETITATRPNRVDAELRQLDVPPDGTFASTLAERRPAARRRFAGTLRRYHAAAVAPYWPDITARARADHALRTRALREGGPGAALAGLGPALRWNPPVLETDYPVDRDLYLGGRGLVLIPSYFCWAQPVALADDDLPPTLVYPLDHDREWLTPRATRPTTSSDPAARLLGPTRAAILRGTSPGATTGELADRIGITPAGVSQHTAVLRDAGLITSHHHERHTVHVLTNIGSAVLQGFTPTA